jgi:teichuronic acid biosynthesis glycosyltransferase TuaC
VAPESDTTDLPTAPNAAAPVATATPSERVRALVFTSLFPSRARPRHGIFVETRLNHLVQDCAVDARVVAPVPWFPSASQRFGSYAAFAATPRRDTRGGGIEVSHPRYWMVPRIGVRFQPDSMARAAWGDVERLRQAGFKPDLIDAHYLYPDGVAAAILARRLGVPFVMTARGTDVNVLAGLHGPGRRIMQAAQQAGAIVAVSQSLKSALVALGFDESKIVVLRNGVDLERFQLVDWRVARERLGVTDDAPLLLSVGNLVPEKDQAHAIKVLQRLPSYRLLLIGDGPLRTPLLEQAERLGVADRLLLRPAMPQQELSNAYAAADVLVLTSTREGWPNVVLESLACGTPVVAMDVGAVREILTDVRVGRIVERRDSALTAAAVSELMALAPARELVRRHAALFDWTSISRGQLQLFRRVVADHAGGRRRPA